MSKFYTMYGGSQVYRTNKHAKWYRKKFNPDQKDTLLPPKDQQFLNLTYSQQREAHLMNKDKLKNEKYGLVKAIDGQVAGNHYKKMAIQPAEYCQRNKLGYMESSAIKYVSRHKDKNGVEDIRKAIHCLELLLEFEYPEGE